MSAPPPPYPGNEPPQQPMMGYSDPSAPNYGEKGGPPPPAGYAPPPAGYPPQGPPPPGPYPQAGYQPPPGQPGYGQPGYGQPAQPGYGQPPSTVVVTQPVVTTTVVQQFRETPVQTVCPHCRASIVTATSFETGSFAWLICVILCLVGCDLGCCFIPFCVDSCKDVLHTCPNCHNVVGRYNRL